MKTTIILCILFLIMGIISVFQDQPGGIAVGFLLTGIFAMMSWGNYE